ncbi:endonuclease/exonuclease/phosphatase family protein [Mangrovibacterium marinum]|uniref:Endonuclease/exonuclease/phosphatase domain-containing protein n=1 Tax=Mangrovibacterium marinum TaxID=1639118 RepID=A0A2T5C1N0_9BACT|nr:endonuclease/exonuclease/phosphatase family protein [Mangrovibacterium marinum]PTN08522.1 hypothetical protein C8N47_10879 [Mangrovibacterium marinum]
MQVPIWVLMNVWKSRHIRLIVLLAGLLLSAPAAAQVQKSDTGFSVLFYNVENLFDTSDDPLTEDDEFCAGGLRNWNSFRLRDKLNKISKVVMAASGFDAPAIIGFCEVENSWVLQQLTENTALRRFNYRIIHKQSPDDRGIDVAIIYRPDKVVPIRYQYHPLISKSGDTLHSREILEATFGFVDDSLHIFVNHWPSRYRGQAQTEPDRMLAAETLRKAVLATYQKQEKAKVILMGDFNDQPDNASLTKGLRSVEADRPEIQGELINLSENWNPRGTLKHRNSWQIFDQIIVSDYLLSANRLHLSASDAQIVEWPFLFEADDRWGGKRLFRTYRGYHYAGGFSDHLPVIAHLHYTH